MENCFVFLVEKEAMWGEMLMEVLKDNGVECVAVPVDNAESLLQVKIRERLKIYVPADSKEKADELLSELFSGAEEETE